MTEQVLKQNPFGEYWKALWEGIRTTVSGMSITLKYFFSTPVTMHYPEARPKIPELHRGLHILDKEACKLCRACAKACPVLCINIEGERKGREIEIFAFDIDYSKCLFCNLCAEACPSNCLWLSERWDLTSFTREGCALQLAEMDANWARSKKWPTLKKRDEEQEARRRAAAQKKGDARS